MFNSFVEWINSWDWKYPFHKGPLVHISSCLEQQSGNWVNKFHYSVVIHQWGGPAVSITWGLGSWQHIYFCLTCLPKGLLRNLKISIFSLPIKISSTSFNNVPSQEQDRFLYHVSTHHPIFPNKYSNSHRVLLFIYMYIYIYIYKIIRYITIYIHGLWK